MYVLSSQPEAGPGVWILSKPIPRDGDGQPVESGGFMSARGDSRTILGVANSVDAAAALIREDGGEVRVADVQKAWEAAGSAGPESDRRIKSRGSYQSAPARSRPAAPGTLKSTSKSSNPLPIVIGLLALAAAAYFFLKM